MDALRSFFPTLFAPTNRRRCSPRVTCGRIREQNRLSRVFLLPRRRPGKRRHSSILPRTWSGHMREGLRLSAFEFTDLVGFMEVDYGVCDFDVEPTRIPFCT